MKSPSDFTSTLERVKNTAGTETALSPRLKEIQGNFAIEGIHISDQDMRLHAAEFESLKKSGKVRERILGVLGNRPFRQG